MTKKQRTILMIFATLAVLAGMTLVILSSKNHRRTVMCEGLRVEFSDNFNFVTEDDIKAYIERNYGSYIGQRLDSVDLARIEKILDVQSAILKSEAYTTEDGMLNVMIAQREPVLRFQKHEIGFYMDERGYIFPLQDNYTSHVTVIDGDIPVSYTPGYKGEASSEKEARWLKGVLAMTKYMAKSKIWSENISQISVNDAGDIVLVPREGKEKFIIGSPSGYEEKLSKIEKYYQYIKPAKEDDWYTIVNVKYNGQIICRRK